VGREKPEIWERVKKTKKEGREREIIHGFDLRRAYTPDIEGKGSQNVEGLWGRRER